jgi:hypothetical protein
VQVGGTALPLPSGFNFGWLYMDMNTTVAAAGANPPVDPAAAQAWIIYTLASNGHFGVGIDAIRLDSACNALHFTPGEVSSSRRFKQDVADMGGASADLMKLRPATFDGQGSNVLAQLQEQHAKLAQESATIEAQQHRIEALTAGQAQIDALRAQVEQLARTVKAQQEAAGRN